MKHKLKDWFEFNGQKTFLIFFVTGIFGLFVISIIGLFLPTSNKSLFDIVMRYIDVAILGFDIFWISSLLKKQIKQDKVKRHNSMILTDSVVTFIVDDSTFKKGSVIRIANSDREDSDALVAVGKFHFRVPKSILRLATTKEKIIAGMKE